MRRAARKDANQTDIVQALRASGAFVWDIGLPVDLLVGYRGVTVLVECKDGSKKRLTGLQDEFFKRWTGGALCRVDGVEAALRILKVIDVQQEQGQAD